MNRKLIVILLLSLYSSISYGQQSSSVPHLSKRVSVRAKQEKISDVLGQISTAGNFYFSYQGTLFKPDSLINLYAQDVSVRDVLDRLFKGKIDYRENGQYVILRSSSLHLTIEPDNITTAEHLYLISGYVLDTRTGSKVKQASVYEKKLLQSALTDEDGYFKLRFKGDYNEVVLTASKEGYRDTSLVFLSNITIKPEGYTDPEGDAGGRKGKGGGAGNLIESLGIGRFLVSSKQRIQSMNIPDFFANSPFQASITPGLSSHGMMSSQVINKGSLNLLGGYTAGLDGFEAAGLFNMSKGNVRYFQMAGLFNLVGGSTEGFQAAGLMNSVYVNSKGVQLAGLFNDVRGESNAFQAGGLFNHVRKNARGVQMSALMNIVHKDMNGFQAAGLLNTVSREMRGVQLSALINYAKKLSGVQIGLINIADHSDGYSIGLINLVKDGYHKISLSSNEVMNSNVAIKLGNAKLYSILMGGKNFSDTAKVEAYGFGLGHDFLFGKRFSMSTEVSAQSVLLKNGDYDNLLGKFQVNLQFQIFKGLTIFGGPAYSVYYSNAPAGSSGTGYKQQVAPSWSHSISDRTRGWLGWNAGITIF
ncbi:carboxypeptidase-like regulatory domain-containing protein [Pedobacter nutrimenti]|uniref:Carboxypeptidase-like protein n=1 Tax=Pedobacter nutrimenti TaxID=1241337 RepID=A0A318URX3_9SPHI|nr:carboxypeptidase-like regulatory domain-containing protein [Pedobacter nutrimenti]PYF76835.1 carboxypeptidase-like protein [Pedobacter nutrimenti]